MSNGNSSKKARAAQKTEATGRVLEEWAIITAIKSWADGNTDQQAEPPARRCSDSRGLSVEAVSNQATWKLEMSVHYEGDMPDTMKDLKHGIRRIREGSPDTWRAWANFVDAALKPSALDSKTKELIALGMSITVQCKFCIGVHVQKCLDAGAKDAEINDVCKVATLLGGLTRDDLHLGSAQGC